MVTKKLELKLDKISENAKAAVSKLVVYGGNYATNFATSGAIGNAYEAIAFGVFDALTGSNNTKLHRLTKSAGYVFYVGSCAVDLYSALKGDHSMNFGQFACDLSMALQLGRDAKKLYASSHAKDNGISIKNDIKSIKDDVSKWKEKRREIREARRLEKLEFTEKQKAIKERYAGIREARKQRIAKEKMEKKLSIEEEGDSKNRIYQFLSKIQLSNYVKCLSEERLEKNKNLISSIKNELNYAYKLDKLSPEMTEDKFDVKGYYTAGVINGGVGAGIGSAFGEEGAILGGVLGIGYTMLAKFLGKRKEQNSNLEKRL